MMPGSFTLQEMPSAAAINGQWRAGSAGRPNGVSTALSQKSKKEYPGGFVASSEPRVAMAGAATTVISIGR
jgi:hypothetical protein